MLLAIDSSNYELNRIMQMVDSNYQLNIIL